MNTKKLSIAVLAIFCLTNGSQIAAAEKPTQFSFMKTLTSTIAGKLFGNGRPKPHQLQVQENLFSGCMGGQRATVFPAGTKVDEAKTSSKPGKGKVFFPLSVGPKRSLSRKELEKLLPETASIEVVDGDAAESDGQVAVEIDVQVNDGDAEFDGQVAIAIDYDLEVTDGCCLESDGQVVIEVDFGQPQEPVVALTALTFELRPSTVYPISSFTPIGDGLYLDENNEIQLLESPVLSPVMDDEKLDVHEARDAFDIVADEVESSDGASESDEQETSDSESEIDESELNLGGRFYQQGCAVDQEALEYSVVEPELIHEVNAFFSNWTEPVPLRKITSRVTF